MSFTLEDDWRIECAIGWLLFYATMILITIAYVRHNESAVFGPPRSPKTRCVTTFIGVLAHSSLGALAVRATLLDFRTHDDYLALFASIALAVIGAAHVSTMRGSHRALAAAIAVPYAISFVLDQRLQGLGVVTLLLTLSAFEAGRSLQVRADRGFRMVACRSERVLMLKAQNYLLKKVLASKTHLIASVGHDLRQPAHTIGLISANLALLKLSPRANEDLQDLLEASAALSDLLSHIMELTQMEIGTYVARIEPVQVGPLLRRASSIYGRSARAKKLELTVDCTQAWVRTDADLLQRILFNLLANAIRYTDRGAVEIGCSEDVQSCMIWIRDTGRGIEANRLPHIFEEFFQVEPSGKEGLGLGLAFVRQAVDLLDHRISVESTPGKGSTFTLHLPRSDAGANTGLLPAAGAHSGGLVAVIEDAPTAQRAICDLLQLWGYKAIGAADAGALDFNSHGSIDVRLIISDLHLHSKENGFAAIARLRALAGNPNLPAILTTGDMGSDIRDQAQKDSIRLLFKPVPPKTLHLEIMALLSASTAAAV